MCGWVDSKEFGFWGCGARLRHIADKGLSGSVLYRIEFFIL